MPERPGTSRRRSSLEKARDDFLAASVAVWREIDEREARPGGYSKHALTKDTEIRLIERAAWHRYRDLLAKEGRRGN